MDALNNTSSSTAAPTHDAIDLNAAASTSAAEPRPSAPRLVSQVFPDADDTGAAATRARAPSLSALPPHPPTPSAASAAALAANPAALAVDPAALAANPDAAPLQRPALLPALIAPFGHFSRYAYGAAINRRLIVDAVLLSASVLLIAFGTVALVAGGSAAGLAIAGIILGCGVVGGVGSLWLLLRDISLRARPLPETIDTGWIKADELPDEQKQNLAACFAWVEARSGAQAGAQRARYWLDALQDDNVTIAVAKDGDAVAGFAIIKQIGNSKGIEALHIDPAYHGQNIPENLISQFLVNAMRQQLAHVTVSLKRDDQAARELFKRFNFVRYIRCGHCEGPNSPRQNFIHTFAYYPGFIEKAIA